MRAPANKPVPATVKSSVKTQGGAWSLHVSLDGSKIRALVRSPIEMAEGARIHVVGSGSNWSLAA